MEAVRQTMRADALQQIMDLPMSMRGGYVDVFVCPAAARYDIPNAQTLAAIDEVQRLKTDPSKKVYDTFDDFMHMARQ